MWTFGTKYEGWIFFLSDGSQLPVKSKIIPWLSEGDLIELGDLMDLTDLEDFADFISFIYFVYFYFYFYFVFSFYFFLDKLYMIAYYVRIIGIFNYY